MKALGFRRGSLNIKCIKYALEFSGNAGDERLELV